MEEVRSIKNDRDLELALCFDGVLSITLVPSFVDLG